MSSTAVALTTKDDKVPAHIKIDAGRGNENVGNNITIPRIKLLQKMSDEVDPGHPKHVKGAQIGHFYNSLTNKIYGNELYVINITFTLEYVVWRKREKGGGLFGNFKTLEDAQAALTESGNNPNDYDITDTHSHLLLIKDPETGELEDTPVIMDFSSSKMRVSRSWNSQIRLKGGDRFAALWKLSSVNVTTSAGNAYQNVDVSYVGWTQKEDFVIAESIYESHAS